MLAVWMVGLLTRGPAHYLIYILLPKCFMARTQDTHLLRKGKYAACLTCFTGLDSAKQSKSVDNFNLQSW